MVVTGNLLDLEETAKAPLSTVSANTTNTDEPPRPQALNSSSVVWVSGHGAGDPPRIQRASAWSPDEAYGSSWAGPGTHFLQASRRS